MTQTSFEDLVRLSKDMRERSGHWTLASAKECCAVVGQAGLDQAELTLFTWMLFMASSGDDDEPSVGELSELLRAVRASLIPRREKAAADYPPFLKAEEVGELLRVHINTVYEAAAREEVPGIVRFGRSIRFRRDAVLDWIYDE